VTAVTFCEDYRRLGIASQFMRILEGIYDIHFKAYFVDLYVRPTNRQAHVLYKNLGCLVYRQIIRS
jgi:N-terminal acetyltransferase B complex catalytic subunit